MTQIWNAGAMAKDNEELPRPAWHDAFEAATKVHQGDDVTIEVLDAEYGDQYEAEKLPFAYIEYDNHDDMVNIGAGGRDGRYPVVLRHAVEHPQRILVDNIALVGPVTVDVLGGDGTQTLVTFYPRAALPD